MISFDEWNVWYQQNLDQCVPTEWTEAPRVSEEAYTVADAVVVGNLLISLLRHSDRVTAACQAQLVNAIAPIRAEPTGRRGARRPSTRSP
jgi:alpha-N-arabinofuranosidase